jgi:hypothetical protein
MQRLRQYSRGAAECSWGLCLAALRAGETEWETWGLCFAALRAGEIEWETATELSPKRYRI